MSGTGITYEQVVIAANQIQSQGQNPTIERIRLHLGSGSNTTINKHLTAWRGQQNQLSEVRATPPDIVKMAAEQAWLEIRKESDAKIDTIKEESAAMILEAEDRAKLAEESEQHLKAELQEVKEKYHAELAEKELLKLNFRKLQQELDLAMERNIGMEARLEDAQTYYTQSVKTLTEAHKKEIEWLTEQFKLQEEFSKNFIVELKLQNEERRDGFIVTINELKTENKSLDIKLTMMHEMLQQKEVELAEMRSDLKHNLNENLIKKHEKIAQRKFITKKRFILRTKNRK